MGISSLVALNGAWGLNLFLAPWHPVLVTFRLLQFFLVYGQFSILQLESYFLCSLWSYSFQIHPDFLPVPTGCRLVVFLLLFRSPALSPLLFISVLLLFLFLGILNNSLFKESSPLYKQGGAKLDLRFFVWKI